MESRSRASPEQFAALLEFMESRGDIARPQQGPQGRLRADRLWQELTVLLNSIGGGVLRAMDKWKKVWADWKAKTKKKALLMRREASGTGGGPSSRQTLTDPEQRVLAIMGLTAVVGQDGIEERGFDEAPSQRSSLPPPIRNPIPELRFADLDVIELELPQIEASTAPSLPQVSTPPPEPVSAQMPSATTSPVVTTSRRGPRRRERPTISSPAASATSTPRRHMLFRARTRRVQTPFDRATNEFVAVENRRLQLEEDRERNNNQREMEQLRLESRRIEMEENRNETLCRLVDVLNNLSQILLQIRPSSLPSTDTLQSLQ